MLHRRSVGFTRAPAVIRLASRCHALLIEPRASGEEDSGRERALNVLLIVSLALALIPALQRAVQISQGGPETTDHVHTLVVVGVAAAAFSLLLWLSRRGRPVTAAWALLGVYYGVGAWSIVAEGPGKSTTILICTLLVVAAGVLCGRRPAALAALTVGVTLILVAALDATGVLRAPKESSPAVPDALGVLEIAGALGAMALLLSASARRRSTPAPDPAAGAGGAVSAGGAGGGGGAAGAAGAALPGLRSGMLTARERQVVSLVALGRTDTEISQELVVSPRTVHSHVSSALRKTACANRTELAVLAVREGLTEPDESAKARNPAHLAT